jgi:hypothetical protein
MIELRAAGWTVGVTERWIPGRNIRVDLFGVGDVLACRAGEKPLLVQVTTASHVSARVAKARAESRLRVWLQTGSAFVVHGWQRVDGKWTCRAVPIVLDDCDGLAALPPPRRRRRPHDRGLFDGLKMAAGDKPSDKPLAGNDAKRRSGDTYNQCETDTTSVSTIQPRNQQ